MEGCVDNWVLIKGSIFRDWERRGRQGLSGRVGDKGGGEHKHREIGRDATGPNAEAAQQWGSPHPLPSHISVSATRRRLRKPRGGVTTRETTNIYTTTVFHTRMAGFASVSSLCQDKQRRPLRYCTPLYTLGYLINTSLSTMHNLWSGVQNSGWSGIQCSIYVLICESLKDF